MMILSEHLKNPVKMCLRVQLVGERSVRIEILSVNKKAVKLTNDYNKKIFYEPVTNFRVWSYNNFSFTDNEFRIPQESNITGAVISSTVIYKNEADRVKALRKLYRTLKLWACDRSIFGNDASHNNKSMVTFNDEYWLIT